MKAKNNLIAYVILLIPVIYLVVFMLVPLIKIIGYSFIDDNGITGEYYSEILTNSMYYNVILVTLRTAAVVTLISLILAYPLAYFMTKLTDAGRNMIMLLVMIPFGTSFLVRTYSWMTLLQTNGVINQILQFLKITTEPIQLMYNAVGVTVAMVHIMIPYMVLSLYSVMEGIDPNLCLASRNLGAGSIRTFFEIYFPLSIQGVLSGCVLVFVLSIGFYITPSLLGGSKDTMIAQLIQTQVSKLLNWNLASAMAVLVLVLTMAIIIAMKKIFKINMLF